MQSERMASNLKGHTFEVKLRIVENPSTGEEFLLRTDEELEELRLTAIRVVQDQVELKRALGADPKFVEQFEKIEMAAVEMQNRRAIEDRDAALPFSRLEIYHLSKPTYGEHLEAENAATEINQDFESRFNNTKFLNYLFPRSVVGMTPNEVNAIPSALIGNALRDAFSRSIFPSPARLPFTSSPSARG